MTPLIIVPARGGSVGIPRKALRELAGMPVIKHTLLAVCGLGDVVVTTDDDDIAACASKAWEQPIAVYGEPRSDGSRSLDWIVADVAKKHLGSAPYLVVVTVQCTSPFLKSKTIRACIEAVESGEVDTALTVRDDRGLRWERSQLLTTKSHMPARLTRQQMRPVWRETGGCLATRAEFVTPHCRFGPRVKLVPVEGAEALDLDTPEDWMLAEAYAKELFAPKWDFSISGMPCK